MGTGNEGEGKNMEGEGRVEGIFDRWKDRVEPLHFLIQKSCQHEIRKLFHTNVALLNNNSVLIW